MHVLVTGLLFVMETVPVRAVLYSRSNASVQLAFAADQSRDLMENVMAMIRAVIAFRNTIYVSDASILLNSSLHATFASPRTDSAAGVLRASGAITWVVHACTIHRQQNVC